MTVAVRGRVPIRQDGRFTDGEATHIAERLQALERAIAGSGSTFLAPSTPTFGSGPIISSGSGAGSGGGGGGGGTGGGTTVTDHGALTGLEDDDHPQYAGRFDSVKPHSHGPFDVAGLESRFPNRFERIVFPHSHMMGDVPDLRPDDAQFVIAGRIYGRRG